MTPPAGKVCFTVGWDLEISSLTTPVLGNYQAGKADGSAYSQGSVSNVWKSYAMAIDRGVQFSLDRAAPNDIEFLATAENVIREVSHNARVREQDASLILRLYTLLKEGELGSPCGLWHPG